MHPRVANHHPNDLINLRQQFFLIQPLFSWCLEPQEDATCSHGAEKVGPSLQSAIGKLGEMAPVHVPKETCTNQKGPQSPGSFSKHQSYSMPRKPRQRKAYFLLERRLFKDCQNEARKVSLPACLTQMRPWFIHKGCTGDPDHIYPLSTCQQNAESTVEAIFMDLGPLTVKPTHKVLDSMLLPVAGKDSPKSCIILRENIIGPGVGRSFLAMKPSGFGSPFLVHLLEVRANSGGIKPIKQSLDVADLGAVLFAGFFASVFFRQTPFWYGFGGNHKRNPPKLEKHPSPHVCDYGSGPTD